LPRPAADLFGEKHDCADGQAPVNVVFTNWSAPVVRIADVCELFLYATATKVRRAKSDVPKNFILGIERGPD
jgi:hypothetical protein